MAYACITDCERKGKPNKKAETPSGCGHSLSRLWNTVFKEYMESTNFKQSRGDSCIFVRSEGTDLTIITKTLEMMRRIKGHSRDTLQDEGPHNCLGITVEYDEEHQKQHIHTI